MESKFNFDFNNATDIANGSIGILRYMVYNRNSKKWRYEYYKVKVVGNKYFGTLSHHTFRVEVIEVLNGKNRIVGDIITRNGKQLYKNYYEIKKAKSYCRYTKHKQKYEHRVKLELGVI